MDAHDVKTAFRKFAGEERFRKFVRAVSQRCPGKGRLFFWHEQLWREFVASAPGAPTSQDEILKAFRICDVHGCDLEPPPDSDSPPEIRDTPEYAQALEALFPLAAS